MKAMMNKGAAVAASLAVLLALGACGDQVEGEQMPVADQANVEINRQGMEGADAQASQGVENNTASMGAAPQDAAAAEDPDVRIANEVKSTLAAHPSFGAAKIDVHSEDGVVTLRGQAPDPAAKDQAADIARAVKDVKSVENQLTLG